MPASPCCPDNPKPVAPPEGYVANGREIEVGDCKCYEVGQASGGPAILVVSDIFGWHSGRTRQICDKFADAGFHVLLPNFFECDGWDHSKPLMGYSAPWYFMQHLLYYKWACHDQQQRSCVSNLSWKHAFYPLFMRATPRFVKPSIQDHLLPYLAASGRKVGVMGFCWGGWITIRSCSLPGVACGVAMHPTMNMEGFHGGSAHEAYSEVQAPLMCLAAGSDPDEVKPGGPLEASMQRNQKELDIREFKDMKHGWFPRGDVSDSQVKQGVALAYDMALEFLNKHLK
jgi:dienelactone hydrolase